jgi:hypothetical protein
MRTLTIYLLAALLAACATATQIVGPGGTPAFSIRCGAAAVDTCYQKAGEVCPSGYTVLNSQGSRYLGQLGTANVAGAYGSATSTPMISPNTMLIECKAAK